MEKPTVLLVDDEPRLLESLTHLLKKEFRVLTASNGREGLRTFRIAHPAIVLLDLDMPIMNGLEMLQELRNGSEEIKVVIMTGRSSHDWAKSCANLRVHGYIEKPFDTKELIYKIKAILGIYEYAVLKDIWGDAFNERLALLSIKTRRVLEFVELNVGNNLCRYTISTHLNVSVDYLSHFFKRECGVGLTEYILLVKLEMSKSLLVHNHKLKIKDVASAAGITDVAYFCRFFKRHTGFSPNKFRQKALLPT